MRKIRHLALSAICSAMSTAAWAQAAAPAPSASASAPQTKQADDGAIQTITITATRRVQNIRDVPQTVEAFSQRMLEDMAAIDISDVVKATPGVELRAPQTGVGGVTIRGVGELNVGNLNGGTGSATGLYLDEIPVTAAGLFPEINTFDLDRVEILKGPQGTLFGEGSLAGTIRLIANKPNLRHFGAAVDASGFALTDGGNGYVLNAMVNVPLSADVAAMRVTLYDRDDPGYVDTKLSSTGAVTQDTNTSKTRGGRLMLRLKPEARQTIDATLMTSDSERGGSSRATDDFIGLRSVLERATDKSSAGNLTWQLATKGVDYLATVSKMKRDVKRITDQLGLVPLSNMLYPAFGLPPVTGVYAPQDVTTDTTAFEVRAVSNDAGALKWTLGAFYKKHDSTFHLTSDAVPLVAPESYAMMSMALSGGRYSDPYAILSDTKASTQQFAVFGDASYDIDPSLQVQGGVRLFQEKRDSTTQYGGVILYVPAAFGGPITPPGTVSTSATDNVVNPRLALSYKPRPGLLSYASVSQGFRSGGQNDLFFSVPGSSPTYEPEKLTSYELGVKSEHMDRKVLVDAALFLLDWKDLQAVIGEGPGGAGEVIGNIGRARTVGIDVSVRARPVQQLELMAGLTLLDARTRNDVTLPDPAGGGTIAVPSGSRIPRAPSQSANLAATYRMPVSDAMNGMLRVGVNHVGDSISFLYRQGQEVAAYTTLDMKAGIEGERWSLYAYATNLADRRIQLMREPSDDPVSGKPQYYWGRPRSIGVNLSYAFE